MSEDFLLINISCLKAVEKYVEILLAEDPSGWKNPGALFSTGPKTSFQQTFALSFLLLKI
ncbi:MAG: hypothetical protein IKX62_01240 [Bacteroidales bacterium]|nr:hypothetical protein [Bacteroidales bacterium]